MLGAADATGAQPDFNTRLALIGGTSSCHMAVSKNARFIDGIWGAYYSAMIPGYWLNEGGQSATGALIDHMITSHPQYSDAKNWRNRISRLFISFSTTVCWHWRGQKKISPC